MSLLDNLKKVRELLSEESKWAKQSFARDRYGNKTCYDSNHACSWCLTGAIYKSINNQLEVTQVMCCLQGLIDSTLVRYNDDESTNHQDIVNLLDNAIQIYE